MHNYIYILKRLIPAMLTASVLVAASGCIKDHVISPADSEVRDVALRLVTTGSGSTTRSAGEDPFNENLINRALIFFYPAVSDDGDDTPAVTCWVESPIGKIGKHEVTNRRLSAGEVQEIFGEEGTQAGRVFVVVNLPDGVTLPENASINQIRHTAVTADFRNGARYDKGDEEGDDYDEEQGGINESEIQSGVQNEFVMLGEAYLKYDPLEKAVTGEVPLTRTAAKIRLALNIPDDIVEADPENPDGTIRWEPQREQIRIFITNGVSKAHIGGDILPVKPKSEVEGAAEHDDYLEETDFYSLNPRGGDWSISRRVTGHESDITPDNPKGYTWWHDVPIYSYPHQWESTPTEEHQPYLVVMVPWRKSGDGVGVEFQYYYYQVPINLRGGTVTEDDNRDKGDSSGGEGVDELDDEDGDDGDSGDSGSDLPAGDKGGFADGGSWNINSNTIESNMYYLLKLEIGMLGSLKYEEPLHIEAQYYVVPWQNETINAELKGTRYLVVDQQAWEMNNTTDLDIPFYTSHETVIAQVKYRFWNFNPVGQNGSSGYYTYWDGDVPQAGQTEEDVDGQAYAITNDGTPLRRTITWRLGDNDKNKIFDTSIEKAREQRLELNKDSNPDIIQNDSIFSFSLDPVNYTVHFHHELKRWTEYTTVTQNGQETELPVFGAAEVGPYKRIGGVVSVYDATDKRTWDVTGFYGQLNGSTEKKYPDDNDNGAIIPDTKYLKRTIDPDDNDNDFEDEWSIISVEITIVHADEYEKFGLNTRFLQTIYITQYPAMYIEADLSSGGPNGSVYVNGERSEQTSTYMWKNVTGGTGTNSNPFMYVVTISQLDKTSDMRIGDPRSLTINNNLSRGSFSSAPGQYEKPSDTWFYSEHSVGGGRTEADNGAAAYTVFYASDESGLHRYDWYNSNYSTRTDDPITATALVGGAATGNNKGKRQLKYYYPTDESTDAGSKANFVAPKLRIASSFGNTAGQFNREMARRRCAAYQEKGRPAGRWRLPTQAEIKFISQLSRKGRIPLLFTPWNAQAIYQGKPIVHAQGDNISTSPYGSEYNNYPHYWSAQGAIYIDDTNNGEVGIYPAPLYDQVGVGVDYGTSNRNKPTQIQDGTTGEYYYPVAGDKNNAIQVAVRCVYDEWYWGDETVSEFTWGDQPKANPQEPQSLTNSAAKTIINAIKGK